MLKPIALAALVVAGLAAGASAQTPPKPLTLTLKTGSPREAQTKQQLERLLRTYGVKRWLFTSSVIIEGGVIPHSHPVLTLSTRHLQDDELLLSTFVHEQIHWLMEAHAEESKKAKDDLRALYPKVPVGFPEGADSEDSTYLHLLVNYLEYKADQELLGELRARQVFEFWTHDHYTWIYTQILESEGKIAAVIRKHKLWVPDPG